MKVIIFYISIILLITSCNTSAQNKYYNKKNIVTFAFYNVENLFDIFDDPRKNDDAFTPKGKKHWTQKRYSKKLDRTSEVLSEINVNELPEFIGLAEVENRDVLEDLINQKRLKSGNYKIIHEESPDKRGIDVALLYRPSDFKELSHRAIPVSIKSNPNYVTRHILYIKGILSGTDTIHIFVNHWHSRIGGVKKSEYKRIIAAKTLRNNINKIFNKNKDAKIIVMGDFNDTPQNKSIYITLFATNKKDNLQFDELYNLMYNKSLNGKGTSTYSGDWYMLDNLIVSKSLLSGNGFTVTHDGGMIYDNPKVLYYQNKVGVYVTNQTYGNADRYYGGYSDHLPVYFMLTK